MKNACRSFWSTTSTLQPGRIISLNPPIAANVALICLAKHISCSLLHCDDATSSNELRSSGRDDRVWEITYEKIVFVSETTKEVLIIQVNTQWYVCIKSNFKTENTTSLSLCLSLQQHRIWKLSKQKQQSETLSTATVQVSAACVSAATRRPFNKAITSAAMLFDTWLLMNGRTASVLRKRNTQLHAVL